MADYITQAALDSVLGADVPPRFPGDGKGPLFPDCSVEEGARQLRIRDGRARDKWLNAQQVLMRRKAEADALLAAIPSPPTPESVQVTVGPGRRPHPRIEYGSIDPLAPLGKLVMVVWHYFTLGAAKLRLLSYVGVGYTSFVDHFHHWIIFAVCAGLSLVGQKSSNYTKFLKGGFR